MSGKMVLASMLCLAIASQGGQTIKQAIELGEVIESFLRKDSSNIGWDYLSTSKSKIQWKTSGIDEKNTTDGYLYYRHGTINIRVNGKASTKLQTKVVSIPWSIVYTSFSNPRFGVETITILPEAYPNACFGTLYDGCDFDIEQTLKASQVSTTLLCENKADGFSQKVYRISKKRYSLIIWLNKSYGSGGSTSEVVIPPQSRASVCNVESQSIDRAQIFDTSTIGNDTAQQQ